jgi:electron transfer flavoprotein alpha/beta subunit
MLIPRNRSITTPQTTQSLSHKTAQALARQKQAIDWRIKLTADKAIRLMKSEAGMVGFQVSERVNVSDGG